MLSVRKKLSIKLDDTLRNVIAAYQADYRAQTGKFASDTDIGKFLMQKGAAALIDEAKAAKAAADEANKSEEKPKVSAESSDKSTKTKEKKNAKQTKNG